MPWLCGLPGWPACPSYLRWPFCLPPSCLCGRKRRRSMSGVRISLIPTASVALRYSGSKAHCSRTPPHPIFIHPISLEALIILLESPGMSARCQGLFFAVPMCERDWRDRSVWSIWFLWFIRLVWFNQIHETDQTDPLTVFLCWRTFSAFCQVRDIERRSSRCR